MKSTDYLTEALELQKSKGEDYNAGEPQAAYYPFGVWSIYQMMHTKMIRLKSVLKKAEAGEEANFESLQDTCVDLINYASFMAAWIDGDIDGQSRSLDLFGNAIEDDYEDTPSDLWDEVDAYLTEIVPHDTPILQDVYHAQDEEEHWAHLTLDEEEVDDPWSDGYVEGYIKACEELGHYAVPDDPQQV